MTKIRCSSCEAMKPVQQFGIARNWKGRPVTPPRRRKSCNACVRRCRRNWLNRRFKEAEAMTHDEQYIAQWVHQFVKDEGGADQVMPRTHTGGWQDAYRG